MAKRNNIDVIAIDFDGTIATGGYPDISKAKPLPDAIRVLKRLVEAGYELVLWTCREDVEFNINKRYLSDAVEFLKENEVEIKYINETPDFQEFRDKKCSKRKVHADIFLDDRNFPFGFNWKFYEHLLLDVDEQEFRKIVTEFRKNMKKLIDKG